MTGERLIAARSEAGAGFHRSVCGHRYRHFAASTGDRLVCAAAFTEQGRAKPQRTRRLLRVLTPKVCILLSRLRASPSDDAGKPTPRRLLDQVADALRVRHYSPKTVDAYVHWIRRFIVFHGRRHPSELGKDEVARFLSHLAVEGKVSASTQNQALSALLFLFADVLGRELGWMEDIIRAKKPG